jgi:hypothetical protein
MRSSQNNPSTHFAELKELVPTVVTFAAVVDLGHNARVLDDEDYPANRVDHRAIALRR